MDRLLVSRIRSSHILCCECSCELRIQRDTRIINCSVALVQRFAPDQAASIGELLNRHTRMIDLLVSFESRSPLPSPPQNEADFGFGTLGACPDTLGIVRFHE